MAVHFACSVTFAAGMVNVDPDERSVPEPFAAVFHPPKVYPARTGNVALTVTVESVVADTDAGAPDPPFAL